MVSTLLNNKDIEDHFIDQCELGSDNPYRETHRLIDAFSTGVRRERLLLHLARMKPAN